MTFPSGHRLDDTYGFLTFWREHHGEQLFGEPVTVPFRENGLMVQYFERGRLEKHTELAGEPVLPGRVGVDYAAALWLTFDPPPEPLQQKKRLVRLEEGERPFEATGYTVAEPFRAFWDTYGGIETFGYPISEIVWDYVGDQLVQMQYFERARLELHENGATSEVRISSLGRDLAILRGHDLSPDGQGAQAVEVAATEETAPPAPPTVSTDVEPLPTVQPANDPAAATPTPLPQPTATPAPAPAAPAPAYGAKYIVVNLSSQWLYAYQGDVLVFEAPVSTGRDGFNTPVGTFSVYAKLPSQTMSGTLGGESYYVPNVPSVMYIYGGVALHGTYWHNQFGTGVRMSHGCINLPLDSAAWLYNWTPMGTTVYVRY